MKCGKKLKVRYKNGTILRADTLNAQVEETTDIRNYAYSDYPDGIVSGFSLHKRSDGTYYFSDGLLKSYGNIYILKTVDLNELLNSIDINIKPDCIYYLCIRKLEKSVDSEKGIEKSPIEESELEIVALRKSEMEKEDRIVAQFMKFANTFKFAETLDEYCNNNYFSTMNGDYSIEGQKSVSSDFTDAIRNELEKKNDKDYLDVALYMNCVQSNRLSRRILIAYCSCKLEKEVTWNEILDVIKKAINKNLNTVLMPTIPVIEDIHKNSHKFDHYL